MNKTGEHCQMCGKEYEYIYKVSDELWEKITGIKNGSGLRCIDCLDKEAKAKGITIYWVGDNLIRVDIKVK